MSRLQRLGGAWAVKGRVLLSFAQVRAWWVDRARAREGVWVCVGLRM